MACPICSGKVTYAFRGRTALAYGCTSVVVAVAALPYLGSLGILAALVVTALASVYLERWY